MNSPKEVIVALFIATDSKDWETVKGYFFKEVAMDYSSMNGQPPEKITPKQIVDSWMKILPGFTHTHHQLGNFVIREFKDEATVSCYGTASHYLEDDAGHLWVVVGNYEFKLIRDAEKGWLVTAMKFSFKYQDGNTALPEKAMKKVASGGIDH